MALGIGLGDGSFHTQNKGKSYRIKLEYGNKEYALHVWKQLDRFIIKEELKAQPRVNENGNVVITYPFSTFSHDAFFEVVKLLIDKYGKRTMPNPSGV